MKILYWLVLGIYFLVMLGMGFWARAKVKTASDFFTAGDAMPWWLSGISHHMSEYSSAVFVAYAAIAYTAGFSIYIWWAAFGLIKCVFSVQIALLPGDLTTTITVAGPVLSLLAVFIGVGLIWPAKKPAADHLLKLINDEDVSVTAPPSHIIV